MASRGVNKAIIVGNLGQDPEMRYMPNGNAVTNISVATSTSWTDKQTGSPQEKTEWHRIVAFNKLAEIMGQYLKKGSQVYIEGRIQTRKWQDKDGVDRYSTEIIADQMQMLGSRESGGTSSFNQDQSFQNAPAKQPQQQAAATKPKEEFKAPQIDNDDDFSDDIPF